jgi:hypothetical protein
METEVEKKLRAENAALRAELQTKEDQLKTIGNDINFYQAFNEQRAKAQGLELKYVRDLGELQRVYNQDRADWKRTVVRLKGLLAAARTEITSLKKEITEGRQSAQSAQSATVSDQSAVLRL